MHGAFERRWLAAVCLTLLSAGPLGAQARVVYDVEAADELSHQTGKPILTIAGTTN
jgi:hypothetical protein